MSATPDSAPSPVAKALADTFRSQSGLRPASAFVLTAFVLVLVAARAAMIALFQDGEQPHNENSLVAPAVSFDLLDARGVPLAVSVEYLELVMSPNAMWQSHTPDEFAGKLSQVLGAPWTAAALLARMVPDAEQGVIVTDRAPLVMDAVQAERVRLWIERGTLDEQAERPRIPGIGLCRGTAAGTYGLWWEPARALAATTRGAAGFEKPQEWTRRIAEDLLTCIHGATFAERELSNEERDSERLELWLALMPRRFRSVVKDVPMEQARALHALLKKESVRAYQMTLRRNAEREYPLRGVDGRPVSGSGAPVGLVLGRWGTLDEPAARKAALLAVGVTEDATSWSPVQRQGVEREMERLMFEQRPESGLELLASDLLAKPTMSWLEREPEVYRFLANQAPRQPLQRYFRELVPGDEVPRVRTTIEADLQRCMHQALERIMVDHKPAIVQAIALDVETGEVLAVDAIDPYGLGGFAPTIHAFTPGSTFKVVIMASALEDGKVRPDELINSYNDHFSFQGRPIHEAEGATDKGIVTAAQGLAYSINAVLVQIGTRVSADVLRGHLLALGYAQYPGSGLGVERCGQLKKLPWVTKHTHASISFGHELMVTLWQHAAALATIVRGGHYRPLRLVSAVEQAGRRMDLPLIEDHPLQAVDSLSRKTCDEVRSMMMLGAREGTGRRLVCDDIVMGTKTGTAQKVPGELCLHVELDHNAKHGCRGARACRALLKKTQRPPHRSCYTSSMCAFGRLPSGGREVMVIVVVDEPRGRVHFGSEVAGPAAIAILREALGLARRGEPVMASEAGFRALEPIPASGLELGSDQPWAEVVHAAR